MDASEDRGDVVVVGAPRSGTSLVAQLLAGAGFEFGDRLLPPTASNPAGFLEDVEVSELADELLAPHVVGDGAHQVPDRRWAWLAVPPVGVQVAATPSQQARMAALLPPAPAGVKDPRFTATLDAWRPTLRPGTSFVGVFRDPAEVAVSLLAMRDRERDYFEGLDLTVERCLAFWEAANRRLLDLTADGRWLLLDHADLLRGDGVAALGSFVDRTIEPAGVDARLHRSRPSLDVSASAEELLAELRDHAASSGGRARA